MITKDQQNYILDLVNREISVCLDEVGFNPTVKEPGHSYGERVEEKLVEKLVEIDSNFAFPTKVKGKGKQTRKMEDVIWNGNLINIKLGYEKGKGQPNMVAFSRLLDKFHTGEIDAYYVLVVNVKGKTQSELTTDVCLFNLFDYLDCINYNYGTGQIMLKESEFFNLYDPDKEFNNTKQSIMNKLAEIDKLAFISHIALKEKQHNNRQQKVFAQYM